LLSNRSRYITEILEGTIDLRKKKKEEVIDMLKNKNYNIIDGDLNYHYLVKMSMDSVTEENVEKINRDCHDKQNELAVIKSTTTNKMWISELDTLKEQYIEYRETRERIMNGEDSKSKKKVVSKSSVKKVVKKQNLLFEE
jgi:hypothetical protein